MSPALRVGISTCPNDTFAFAGLLLGEVDPADLQLSFELADVQVLNRALARGAYDLCKASFHAALARSAEVVALPVGAALGFGVGPVLLARRPGRMPGELRQDGGPMRVLGPGPDTTAALLYELYHRGEGVLEHAVFSDIIPAVQSGAADLGLCIHEARFTFADRGLHLVEDLGARWEADCGLPLPLGGLFARASLEAGTLDALSRAVQNSLAWGGENRGRALEVMRAHAAEQDDRVLWAHVELYVNELTRSLGEQGRAAIRALAERAAERGLLDGPPLRVCGRSGAV